MKLDGINYTGVDDIMVMAEFAHLLPQFELNSLFMYCCHAVVLQYVQVGSCNKLSYHLVNHDNYEPKHTSLKSSHTIPTLTTHLQITEPASFLYRLSLVLLKVLSLTLSEWKIVTVFRLEVSQRTQRIKHHFAHLPNGPWFVLMAGGSSLVIGWPAWKMTMSTSLLIQCASSTLQHLSGGACFPSWMVVIFG